MASALFRGLLLVCVAPLLLGETAAMDDDNLAGTLPYKIDCDNPYVCLDDIEPHCTSTGQVFGHCGLQIAICLNGEVYDPSGKCLKN